MNSPPGQTSRRPFFLYGPALTGSPVEADILSMMK